MGERGERPFIFEGFFFERNSFARKCAKKAYKGRSASNAGLFCPRRLYQCGSSIDKNWWFVQHTYAKFKIRKARHRRFGHCATSNLQCIFLQLNGRLQIFESLVRHLKSHMVSLPMGVDLVLGHNGIIWVTHSKTKAQQLHYEKLAEFYKQRTISIPNEVTISSTEVRVTEFILHLNFQLFSVPG